MIEKLLCHKDKSILDALRIINENTKSTAFIVDSDNKLCGILTDGDIRRVLLSGADLQQKVDAIVQPKMTYVKKGTPVEEMLKKISVAIWIIPIVDDNMRVVDYFEFRENIHIPLVAPNLKGNEFKYLVDAFLSSWISSSGQYIERFEKDFARYCGCKHGIAVTNGTAALHLALLACDVRQNDEVIIPDLTFASPANAALYVGAKPVIVDVQQDSWCIDPDEIEKAITKRTKAVIVVHLYGQPCDMDRIMAIAKKHKLIIIEDCAEAHGASYNGKMLGSFGDVSCFSFFGNKVITTGEGGMCLTSSDEMNDRIRVLRDHGMNKQKRYWHDVVGYNYRMTNLQAAIGVAQLERIEEVLRERAQVEDTYRAILNDIDFIEFQKHDLPGNQKITWLVTALIHDGKRDQYLDQMKKNGIDARIVFYPLSCMEIYKPYVFSNKVSKMISEKGISLPTQINLPEDIYKKIAAIFRSAAIEV